MGFMWSNCDNVIKMTVKDIHGLKLVKDGNLGETSKVYQLNDQQCIKVFNKSKKRRDLERLNSFSDVHTSCANIPSQFVLINYLFKACITDYINGTVLTKFDEQTEYSKFLILADQLISSSLELSESGVRIFDLHSDNIMYDYDNQCLVLIDTMEWNRIRGHITETQKWNFRIINRVLEQYMFGIGGLWSTYVDGNFISINDDYIDYYESLKEKLEKENGIKIKTLKDAKTIGNDTNGNKKY